MSPQLSDPCNPAPSSTPGVFQPVADDGNALPRGIRFALTLLAFLPPVAIAAEDVRVEAARAGAAVAVSAQASVKAPLAIIWSTLTDYERLPEFVPGMKRSRIIGRRGPAAIVEQDGEAGFLIFKFPIHVVVESAEYPPNLITIHVVRGNLRQLEGQYRIERGASAEEHVLHWSGTIEPDTMLPAFITVPLMRANIEDQFAGMVREIKRRNEARAKKVAPDSDK
jgi:ribosome-associated toxin RatA of RatAB toxin-antitoxin module